MATPPTVAVTPHWGEAGEGTWRLEFVFDWPEGPRFSFTATEPYLFAKEAWLAVARGEGKPDLYFGKGEEGSISLGAPEPGKDRVLQFSAQEPSAAGGGIIAFYEHPLAALAGPLAEAIEKAAADGMRFASR